MPPWMVSLLASSAALAQLPATSSVATSSATSAAPLVMPTAVDDPAAASARDTSGDASAAPDGAPVAALDAVGSTAAVDAAALTAPVGFDVTVRARRAPRTPGSAHVVRSQELERFQQDDVNQVLYAVPGVYVRGEDGVGLRPNIAIRGTNPDRSKKITLMEDGILFAPAPYSASAAYYFPMITRMSEVRVLKGPASIGYGPHTVGGAVDLITRAVPSGTAGSLDVAGGMYGFGKLHAWAGSRGEDVGFLIEGAHLRESGFKQLPDPDAETGFYRNEWMAKGHYLHEGPGDTRGELRLKLGFTNERSNETYLGLTDADFQADPLQRYAISQLDQMNFHRTSAVLSHVWHLAPKLTLSTAIYRHDLTRSWRKVNGFRGASLFDVLTDPDDPRSAVFYDIIAGRAATTTPEEVLLIGPNEREYVSQGVDLRARWEVETGPIAHRLELGVRGHYDRIERRHSEDGFRVLGDRLEPEGSPTVVTTLNEASTIAVAVYVADALTWGDLTLTPGLRTEIIRSTARNRIDGAESVRNHVVLLPGVGAYYAIVPELGVLASVHRGFSPPAPEVGKDPEPELSVAYEVGARLSYDGLRAELIGYYNDYSNFTDVCTFASGCRDDQVDRQFDAGAARIYGLEALVAHELRLGSDWKAPVSASYTLSRGELLESFESSDPVLGSVQAGDEMAYVPMHQLHATLGLEHARGGVNVAATYVPATRETAGSGPLEDALATDEQWLIDVSGRVDLLEWLSLYVNVRNVLDEAAIVSRRPFGARPNAPRWLQVGLEATF